MVIKDGVLQSLYATVTADFNFKGLHIAANQLTVGYDAIADNFTLDGSLGVTLAPTPTAAGTDRKSVV